MGKAIETALAARGHEIAGRIDEGEPPGVFLEGESGSGKPAGASSGAAARAVDVAFEFTTPAAAESLVVSLLSKQTPVVSGTTGWDVSRALEV